MFITRSDPETNLFITRPDPEIDLCLIRNQDMIIPHGPMPTNKQIVENMMYLLRTNRAGQAQRSREDAALILAEILEDHWNFCNIYTIRTKNILSKILNLYNEFTKLVQVREKKKGKPTRKKWKILIVIQKNFLIFSVRTQ